MAVNNYIQPLIDSGLATHHNMDEVLKWDPSQDSFVMQHPELFGQNQAQATQERPQLPATATVFSEPKKTFWDKYNKWIIAGGLLLTAGGIYLFTRKKGGGNYGQFI